MPFAMSLDRTLAHAGDATWLTIRQNPCAARGPLGGGCDAHRLHPGLRVRVVAPRRAGDLGPVLVETAAGERLAVPLEYAAAIECAPVREAGHATGHAEARRADRAA